MEEKMPQKPTLNIVLVEPPHPPKHRQRGPHLRLHRLPAAPCGTDGFCD